MKGIKIVGMKKKITGKVADKKYKLCNYLHDLKINEISNFETKLLFQNLQLSHCMERKKKPKNKMDSQQSIEAENISTSKNVHFTDYPIKNKSLKNKHRSSSILKKKTSVGSFQNYKIRSDSMNSLAGHNPKDDQSCENNHLNKIVKQQYCRTVQKYSQKQNYIDEFFPPNISSLFSSGKKNSDHKIKQIKWKRLGEVFPDRQLSILNGDPWKNYIQSSTKLCSDYFPLALNCLKNNKSLLKKIFENTKINSEGIYFLKVFQANIWKNIIIDDYIPVYEETEKKGIKYIPAFVKAEVSQNKQQSVQIWPYLFQKAYAKYYSSYETLQTGNIFDFLQQVSNQSFEEIRLTTTQLNLKDIFKQPDLIIIGQEIHGSFAPLFSSVGNSERVFFLSTDKPGYKNNVNVQQLSNHFNYIYVYGYKKYLYSGFCPIRQAKQSISIRYFELKQPAKCSLSLIQKDQRLFKGKIQYTYSWIRMVILQKQCNEGYRWIDARYQKYKSITMEVDFHPGQYYVIIFPQWKYRAYDLNLIIRTKLPLQILRKPYKQGILEEGCADLAQRFGKMNQLNTYICSYNCIHQDLGLIIQNINNEKTKGNIRILRSIQGLNSSLPIIPLNKEFKDNKDMEITIKSYCHYTVVLMMKGGIDKKFFQNFDFCSK